MLSLFGPTSARVRFWGILSLAVGIPSVLLAAAACDKLGTGTRTVLIVALLVIAALQIAPIALWWQTHSSNLSGSTAPGTFVAHWAFSVPHIVLLVVSLLATYSVWFERKPN